MTIACALAALSWPERMGLWLLWAALLGPLYAWTQRHHRPGWPRAAAAAPLVRCRSVARARGVCSPLMLSHILGRTSLPRTAAHYCPQILINLLVPLLFGGAEVLTCFTVAVATSFLTNLKLLAWIEGRGSLEHPRLNLAQWVAVASLPITPAAGQQQLPCAAASAPPSVLTAPWLPCPALHLCACPAALTAPPCAAVPPEEPSSSSNGKGNGDGEEAEDSQAKAKGGKQGVQRRKGRIHEVEPGETAAGAALRHGGAGAAATQ